MLSIRWSARTVIAVRISRDRISSRVIVMMLHRSVPVWPIVPRLSSCYHIAPFELAGPSAGSNRRTSVIFRGPLPAIGASGVFMFDLLSPRFGVMFVLRNPFALA